MKIIDDLLKDHKGIWKAERIWTNFALVAYHTLAFVNRYDITLWNWVTAYITLHGALFVTNGVKTFLDNKGKNPDVTIS